MKNLLFSLILLCACSVSQSAKAQQLLEALEGEQSTKWKGTLTYDLKEFCIYDYNLNSTNYATAKIDLFTQYSYFQCASGGGLSSYVLLPGRGIGYDKHCDDIDTSVDTEKQIDIKFPEIYAFGIGSPNSDYIETINLYKVNNGYHLLEGITYDYNTRNETVRYYCIK